MFCYSSSVDNTLKSKRGSAALAAPTPLFSPSRTAMTGTPIGAAAPAASSPGMFTTPPRTEPTSVHMNADDTPSSINREGPRQPMVGESSDSNIEAMIKRMGEMMDRIKDLEEKLAKKEKDTEQADANTKNDRDKDDKLKLKPIDIKDVKKPEGTTAS